MPVNKSFDSIFSAVQKSFPQKKDKTKKSYEIEGLLKPTMKDGKFNIVLRFLPGHPDEDMSYVENRTHMMQLPNGEWFGCDCLRKFGDDEKHQCPICRYNNLLFKKYGKPGIEEYRKHALPKWQPKYYANVLVIRNSNAPETEGQIFKFEFKRAIMKFISEAMNDKKDELTGDVTPGINPFSWYGPKDEQVINKEWRAGANFVWEGYQTSNGPNYEKSHWTAPSRISMFKDGKLQELTDDEINELEQKQFRLSEIEKKEEDCSTYAQIVKRYKKKTGKFLFAEFGEKDPDENVPQAINVNEVVKADFPKAETVEVDDSEMFASNPKDEPEETAEELDNDDFFERLSRG